MKKAAFKFSVSADYAICTALLPFVLMLYQYQRNIIYLSISHVLAFSGIMAALLLVGYYTVKYLFKTEFGAFVFCVILFVSFFTYRSLIDPFFDLLAFLRMGGDMGRTIAYAARIVSIFIFTIAIAARIGSAKRLQKFNWHTVRISIGIGGGYWNSEARIPIAACLIAVLSFLALWILYSLFLGFFDAETRGPLMLFYSAAIVIALILVFICRKLNAKLQSKALPYVSLVLLGAILIQNIAGIAVFASQQKTNDIYYKESFNVETKLASQPNVYWFHCDGMLGFESMERLYGEEQKVFSEALEKRGFWLNRNAAFEADHGTRNAIPALMSPYYYDRVLSWDFDTAYAEANPQNADLLNNPDNKLIPNNASLRRAREKNELVAAFNTAGYNTSAITRLDSNNAFYPTVNQYYIGAELLTTQRPMTDTLSLVNEISQYFRLLELLNNISPIPSISGEEHFSVPRRIIERGFASMDIESKIDLFEDLNLDDVSRQTLLGYSRYADCFVDTMTRPGPRFTAFYFLMSHYPFVYNEQGHYNADDSANPSRYLAHHKFSASTLLKYIDMILESDPDAVIVLQADHGVHTVGFNQARMLWNLSEEQMPAIWNQVMCAVRLPKDKLTPQTQEILSDPRNISRYLVNEYVGQNYEYIPSRFRQYAWERE